MKRLCIYVIYDKQNAVNPYIESVLIELLKFVSDIFVVCNFESISRGQEYIEPYAKKIICRENKGYDAGAYQEALNRYISWESIAEYDELILTNDTYFAPLYPFDDMFDTMQKDNCDYWGITRHPEGYIKEIGNFENHIQSYFLCFKNRIINDEKFRLFWENYKCSDIKEKTIQNFELGINRCLSNYGYKGTAYMDVKELDLGKDIEFGSYNPYSRFAFELIKEGKIPIIKKTNFYGKNRWLVNTMKALQYIKDNCNYNADLITKYVNEYRYKGLIGPYFEFEKLDKFVNDHSRVFIYGAGIWGRIVYDYLTYRNLKFDGFVVSRAESEELEFSSVDIKETDGIIVAQEFKNICDEIIEYIKPRVSMDQVFTPVYPD